jgi:hypothetical protein
MIRSVQFDRSAIFTRLSSAAALLLGALAGSGLACSSDTRPPSLVALGGQANDGGSSGSPTIEGGSGDVSGASGGSDAGAGGAAADGGSAGAPAELGGSSGTSPAVPAVCEQSASWSAAASVGGVSSGAGETLLALTPDELDLAFLRDGALFVAHRSKTSAAFSSGAALSIPAGWSAGHGASLSADGKRLLLVSEPDQKKLGELTRSNRESAFSTTIDSEAFAAINGDSDFTRRVYASPTLSAGDEQLFFNSALDAESTIMVSSRAGTGAWSAPKALSAGIFDGSDGKRRLPTGVSADGRTLFYFNEESAEEEARWRATNSIDSPLYDMLSLGARRGAAPNSACNRLYSAAVGDVVVEKD